MRIITMNIQHGGGKRVSQLLEHITRMAPDILVLSEFRNNLAGQTIRDSLLEQGLIWQQTIEVDPKTNTLLIASCNTFSTATFHDDLGINGHRCLKACFSEFDLYGLYFPNQKAKQPVFDFLNKLHPRVLENHSLLLGDFNTGCHFADESGKTFLCASDFEKLIQRGWIDTWRSRNPDSREFSWYSNAGNGFRIDQALASPPLNDKIERVHYDHFPRETQATDHSAMVLDLKL